MNIKITAYGDLKFYTPGKFGVVEIVLNHPQVLSEILRSAGIPLEYVGPVAVGKITADLNTVINSDAEINVYPMVSGG